MKNDKMALIIIIMVLIGFFLFGKPISEEKKIGLGNTNPKNSHLIHIGDPIQITEGRETVYNLKNEYRWGDTLGVHAIEQYNGKCNGNVYLTLEVYSAPVGSQKTKNYEGGDSKQIYSPKKDYKYGSDLSFKIPDNVHGDSCTSTTCKWSISAYYYCNNPSSVVSYSADEINFNVVKTAPPIAVYQCKDDDAYEFTIRNTAYLYKDGTQIDKKTDECSSSTKLKEYICESYDSKEIDYVSETCAYGCADGKCLPKTMPGQCTQNNEGYCSDNFDIYDIVSSWKTSVKTNEYFTVTLSAKNRASKEGRMFIECGMYAPNQARAIQFGVPESVQNCKSTEENVDTVDLALKGNEVSDRISFDIKATWTEPGTYTLLCSTYEVCYDPSWYSPKTSKSSDSVSMEIELEKTCPADCTSKPATWLEKPYCSGGDVFDYRQVWKCIGSECKQGSENKLKQDCEGKGCENGKCGEAPTCTDTDGGNDIYTKGTTKLGSAENIDYCISDTKLQEYYCSEDNSNVVVASKECPTDYKCIDGACIKTGDITISHKAASFFLLLLKEWGQSLKW